jgi:hypothetical protein
VIAKKATVAVASAILMMIAVGGCSSRPTSIVDDDAALCEYSARASGSGDVSHCRGRLDSQHRRLAAGVARRIDGYALLNSPERSDAVADQCKAPNAPKDCGVGDITGTIPAQPKR